MGQMWAGMDVKNADRKKGIDSDRESGRKRGRDGVGVGVLTHCLGPHKSRKKSRSWTCTGVLEGRRGRSRKIAEW